MALPNYNVVLQRIEKKASRFVIGAILLMALILVSISIKQEYFRQTTPLYFLTSDAQGLSKGMAVKFIGFKVGSVDAIVMQPNATVKVKMSLNNDYLHFIGQDAKARLLKEGLVGEGVVEIIQGDTQAKRVIQDDVLEFERGHDVGQIAENLADQVEPILRDVKQITAALNDPNDGIRQIIKNINQASIELRDTGEELRKLTKSGNYKVDALYVKLERALDHSNSSLEVLNKNLPKLMSKADSTLDNIKGATADIKIITTETSSQAPSLLRNANLLIQDGQDAVNGAKKSWLFEGYFPKPEEQMLPTDSYVQPAERK